MARSWDQRGGGVGADGRRRAGGEGGVAVIVLARHHQDRDGDGGEPVPQRGLGAGAGPLQAGGQALGPVAAALVLEAAFGRQPGEHRQAEPVVDEGGHALVRGCAGASTRSAAWRSARSPASSMPGVAPSTTRARTTSGRSTATEGHAAAHRVAEVDGRPPRRGDQPGGRRQVDGVAAGAAVARGVEPDHLWWRASAGASGPQHRPVCPKPWSSTTGGPAPSRSLWSGTARDSCPCHDRRRPPRPPTCRRRSPPPSSTSGCATA